MEIATQPPPKRARFDSSVITDADKDSTPMATARNVLTSHCASLQPDIANLLSTLGKDHLLTLQKISHKNTQAKKLSDDKDLIPRSARIKFTLTTGKLAEKDEGYIRLKEETDSIIVTFQQALKTKIIAVAVIESKTLRSHAQVTFTNHLFLTTKALLICDNLTTDPHRVVNTLLDRYSLPLLSYLDIELTDFRALYQRTHSLIAMPPPFDLPTLDDPRRPAHQPMPIPSAVCQAVSTIYRVLDNTFLAPWAAHQHATNRNEIHLALKTLRATHLEPDATDAAIRMIDAEASVAPPQLRNVIDNQVYQRTLSLEKEIASLKKEMLNLKAKKFKRGPQQVGASQTKKIPAAAAVVPAKDTVYAAKRKKQKPTIKKLRNKSNLKHAKQKNARSATSKKSDKR